MKVLITAPSLDEKRNVSGISTLVRQIIRRGAADFVHFQAGKQDGEKTNAGWFFQQAALMPRFLRTIRREKIDLVHLNTALVPLAVGRDAALACAARLAGKPLVVHLHGGRFLMEPFISRALAFAAETMLRRADRVIVLSEREKASLTNRWRDVNVVVLPNAVETGAIPTRERSVETEKTVVYLGRLHESKGLPEIVEACRRLKNENVEFRFECFGAGALKDSFVSEMTAILGDKFHYGGVASGAEKWRHLADSDVFLLPSRYGEGLPIALLEAMAAGCVAVAADVASVRAVVEDSVNGLMVEPYNAAQVAEKLKFALLSAESDLKEMRAAARRTIEEKFAFGDYIEKLERIYVEVSEARKR